MSLIKFRSDRLKPLHKLQISQLKTWRELKAAGKDEEAQKMLPDMQADWERRGE